MQGRTRRSSPRRYVAFAQEQTRIGGMDANHEDWGDRLRMRIGICTLSPRHALHRKWT